jgi:FADH2-dependent halogenase
MLQGSYDAVIIGGGPGGSTVATLLAKAGKRVLLLEKEQFPRFHIGESLLPYNRRIFDELGILPRLEAAGFPVKTGAQFHLGNSSKALKLVFKNGCFTRETTAFQVERSVFDDILLKHSQSSGAEVLHGWTATRFANEQSGVAVEARKGTENAIFRGSFLVDASGRGNCTGNQERLRVVHPGLKKVAIFGHFEGVQLDQGQAAGDTVIIRLENKWFWIIPIGKKISVGCVLDQAELAAEKLDPAILFERIWRSSAEMRERMRHARLTAPIQVTSDFSYYNRRLVGPRLVRVGDAAGFMDPIFSAGVYLAMYSGRLAAQVVLNSLAAQDDGRKSLAAYEKRVFHALNYYWTMVEKYYTSPFMELFMEPRPKLNLPDAIVAILAGELEAGWTIEIRRRIFFALVWLQRYVPVVPRISFAESPPPQTSATTLSSDAAQADPAS